MSSIQQQISSLLQPTNPSYNIDRQDVESNETLRSNLRTVNNTEDVVTNFASRWSKGVGADFRIGNDERYVSEKISRKDIQNSEPESETSISEGEYESYQQMLTNELENQNLTFEDTTHIEDSDTVLDELDALKTTVTNDDQIKGIIEINQKSTEKDARKGRAILKQYRTWEGVLEARIHAQNCLVTANSLPHPDEFDRFCEQAGSLVEEPLRNAKLSLNQLISELVKLQTSMVSSNKFKGTSNNNIPNTTKQWLSQYQIDVIKEWEDKTRLLSSAFTRKGYVNVERSVQQQIEYALSKCENLINKTQIKRLEFEGLGKRKPIETIDDTSAKKRDLNLSIYHENIFDDTDFYHQLLQDLIRNKTTSNVGESSQKWLDMNRNRSNKSKRNVNTKASKGRKIRYDVYQKLVSFMAPKDDSVFNDATRNELFRSLFGQTNLTVEP